jgi:hypothetical protein
MSVIVINMCNACMFRTLVGLKNKNPALPVTLFSGKHN